MITLPEIPLLRMQNQKIESSIFNTPKEVVAWMGAMQAQDFAMAKWAIGKRLNQSTENTILAAYNKGDIIRTHVMRPTWHFVSSDDIYWMLELTATHIKPLLKTREKQLEITGLIFSKCNRILEKILSNGQSKTREELAKEFNAINIQTNENRLSHLMIMAELEGLVCSGPIKENKLTYSLLSERVTTKKNITRDEGLAKLAGRYFNSHCPATIRDFAWWSGLSVTNAKRALEMIKTNLNSEVIDSETYWIANDLSKVAVDIQFVHLLPAYDEFLIGYKNRSAALANIDTKKTISENGIFRPVILVNGQVIGIWKRNTIKGIIKIETDLFDVYNEKTSIGIKNESIRYGDFLNHKIELISNEKKKT